MVIPPLHSGFDELIVDYQSYYDHYEGYENALPDLHLKPPFANSTLFPIPPLNNMKNSLSSILCQLLSFGFFDRLSLSWSFDGRAYFDFSPCVVPEPIVSETLKPSHVLRDETLQVVQVGRRKVPKHEAVVRKPISGLV